MTNQWQEMTQEELMNVQVGDKIRIDGVETEVTKLYDRDCPDYGFDITAEVDGSDIIGHSNVEHMDFTFEKPINQPAQTFPSLSNKKIWVKDLTKDQKKRIQDVAFEQGFLWYATTDASYRNLNSSSYFFYDDGDMTSLKNLGGSDYFNHKEHQEITYEEIFGESSKQTIKVGDYVRVIASDEELASVGNEYNQSGETYKVVRISGNGSSFALGGDPDKNACWVSDDCIELCEAPAEETVREIPSRLVPTVGILQQRCSKANVQVLVRNNSFTIYSEEDEREIRCNTEEELFDILDQLVTIQEMSEKIGWTV